MDMHCEELCEIKYFSLNLLLLVTTVLDGEPHS